MNMIIILIILLVLIFGLSSDQRLNDLIKDKSVPFIMLLVIFYFFFNKIDLRILCLILIIVMLFFSKFGNNIRDKINKFLNINEPIELKEDLIQDNLLMENEINTNSNKNELLKIINKPDNTENIEIIESDTPISQTIPITNETIESGTPISQTISMANETIESGTPIQNESIEFGTPISQTITIANENNELNDMFKDIS